MGWSICVCGGNTVIDLSIHDEIRVGNFVKINFQRYFGDTGVTLKYTDYYRHTIDGEVYTPTGTLMSISSVKSEMKVSAGTVSVTLAGLPDEDYQYIKNNRLKWASIQIYRAFFDDNGDPLWGADSVVLEPQTRFKGIISNYSLTEDYDINTKTASNIILLECTSSVILLQNKIAGRKTNQQSQQQFYPDDLSMNRVTTIQDTDFVFGYKQE